MYVYRKGRSDLCEHGVIAGVCEECVLEAKCERGVGRARWVQGMGGLCGYVYRAYVCCVFV